MSAEKKAEDHFPNSEGNLSFIDVFFQREKHFIFFVAAAFAVAGIVTPYTQIAMWFGFALAGYSAIANDSIQTLGTFIAANEKQPWWHLWFYIGGIFVVTVVSSWLLFDGDVSWKRLQTPGFSESPQSFQYLQVAAPIVLLILTRLRMPVSTTFLLLSSFSTESGAIVKVMQKSVLAYFFAFVAAALIWILLYKPIKSLLKGEAGKIWTVLQWLASGILWSVWIMQDAANIAIYLPRSLNLVELIAFTGLIFCGLGVLFYLRGDKIQSIVNEKAGVRDMRTATLINFVFGAILLYKLTDTIPMSTTWVFIGLLGGRELAVRFMERDRENFLVSLKMIARDVTLAFIGLIISILLAVAVNPSIREEILTYIK